MQERGRWHSDSSSKSIECDESEEDSAPCTPESLDLEPAEYDEQFSDTAPKIPPFSELQTGAFSNSKQSVHKYIIIYLISQILYMYAYSSISCITSNRPISCKVSCKMYFSEGSVSVICTHTSY